MSISAESRSSDLKFSSAVISAALITLLLPVFMASCDGGGGGGRGGNGVVKAKLRGEYQRDPAGFRKKYGTD